MTTATERLSAAEQNLNTNVLAYIGQLAAEGRYAVLLGLGVRQDQIPKLSALSFHDIAIMAASALSAALIHTSLDANVLDIVFRNLERSQLESERARQLILAGASQRLMEELTGMDGARYAQYRLILGLQGTGGGRPRELLREGSTPGDLEGAGKIWQAWQASEDLEEAERWLWVHDTTGYSLRIIERVVRTPALHDGLPGAAVTAPWRAEGHCRG